MKTSMERVYPIALDMEEQSANCPTQEYVFFYDDGGVFRAFLVDGVLAEEKTVTAYVNQEHANVKKIITIPGDSTWRMVHKSRLEFVNGATMEQLELIGAEQKRGLKEKMLKKLGYDKDGKKVKRADPSLEGIKQSTGQYV